MPLSSRTRILTVSMILSAQHYAVAAGPAAVARCTEEPFFERSGAVIEPYGAEFMASRDYHANYASETDSLPHREFKHELVNVYQYSGGDYVGARGFWQQTAQSACSLYCTGGTKGYEASQFSGNTGCARRNES